MDLNGEQRAALRNAILSSFSTWGEMQILVDDRLNERLQNVSSQFKTMPEVVHDLIGWTQSRGRVTELVIGASAEKPNNSQLKAFAETFKFVESMGGELERIVMPMVSFENVGQWIAKFAQLRRAVARFEDDTGFGTAFLVAPDLLMTNHHVVEKLLVGKADSEEAVVLFDYELGVGGAEPTSRACGLAAEWDCGHNHNLDYALVRLAERSGDDALEGGQRGFINLADSHNPIAMGPIMILQHPDAMPLKLSIGTIDSIAPDGKGVSYTANTMSGSSGSPCFNSALQPIILHNSGSDKKNHGIRLDAIFNDLKLRKLDGLLG